MVIRGDTRRLDNGSYRLQSLGIDLGDPGTLLLVTGLSNLPLVGVRPLDQQPSR